MRVLRHGKENLDIELSGTAYQICGDLGGAELAFRILMNKFTK